MTINFNTVYLMSDLNGQFFPKDVTVTLAGCRIVLGEGGVLQFGCCAGNEKGGIFFPVEVLEDTDGVLLLKDLLPKPDAPELVVWKLEPYTIERWHEQGKKGKIPLYDELKDRLLTTDDLQVFLFNELVDDWWIEDSKDKGVRT